MAGADGAAASHEIIVPLVMIRFRGQWSHIAVQNTDASQAATVTLDLLRTDSSLPVLTKSYLLAPGSPIWLDLRTNGAFIGIAPNTPDGFLGSMRISSAAEVAVHVVNDIEMSERGVHDYNGIPRAAGSPRLHIPLVVQGPGRDAAVFERTWLGVSNAGTIPAAVRVTYLRLDGPCNGQTFVQGPRVLLPLAMTMFDSTEAPGALPDGCLASATISSDGPNLAAAVVHLFERPADRRRGCARCECPPRCAVLSAGRTHRFVATDLDVLTAGFDGSAVVRSDAPILVWLRDAWGGGGVDETLSAAMPVAVGGGDNQAPNRTFNPIFFKGGQGPPPPSPPPARTSTATPAPVPTAEPSVGGLRSIFLPAASVGTADIEFGWAIPRLRPPAPAASPDPPESAACAHRGAPGRRPWPERPRR